MVSNNTSYREQKEGFGPKGYCFCKKQGGDAAVVMSVPKFPQAISVSTGSVLVYCIQKELVPELPQAISVGTGSVQVYCIQKQSVPRLPQVITVGTGSVYAKKFPTWEILGER